MQLKLVQAIIYIVIISKSWLQLPACWNSELNVYLFISTTGYVAHMYAAADNIYTSVVSSRNVGPQHPI